MAHSTEKEGSERRAAKELEPREREESQYLCLCSSSHMMGLDRTSLFSRFIHFHSQDLLGFSPLIPLCQEGFPKEGFELTRAVLFKRVRQSSTLHKYVYLYYVERKS
jgi:hypothetical protein